MFLPKGYLLEALIMAPTHTVLLEYWLDAMLLFSSYFVCFHFVSSPNYDHLLNGTVNYCHICLAFCEAKRTQDTHQLMHLK